MKDYSVGMQNSIFITLFALCIVSTWTYAEIYRSVDAYGNVSYSDESSNGAEEIEVNTGPIVGTPATSLDEDEVGETKYKVEDNVEEDVEGDDGAGDVEPTYKLTVVTPPNGKSVRNNAGNLMVSVSVNPDLDKSRGDKFITYLDGNPEGKPKTDTIFELENIDRGAHTIRIDLVDKSGNVLTSASSAFQLHRHSTQHN